MAFVLGTGLSQTLDFTLRAYADGPGVVPGNWNDGTSSSEWPTVQILTPAGENITAQFAQNTSGVDLGGVLKHPQSSTGLFYRRSGGRFGMLVKPNYLLGPGVYRLVIAFNAGVTVEREFALTLTEGGVIHVGSQQA